jgi:hypothetical protein
MAKRRQPIPQKTQDQLLFLNDHTCCICRVRGKDVQVHHIDGKARNNDRANLAVVCLDCHSRVTGTRGLGKRYAPGEVRRFKRSWEQQVLSTRSLPRPVIRYRKELLSQIDLLICQILARENDPKRAKELLEVLLNLHIWRWNKQLEAKIVEGLDHLALMSGLSNSAIAPYVAEKLWEMCFHYVGPHEVPMDKLGLRTVLDCLKGLSTLAVYNSEFGRGRRAAYAAAAQAENFFEIGLWYSRKKIVNGVLTLLEESIQKCYDKKVLKFPFGRATLRRSARRLQRLLGQWRPGWKPQARRLENLLAL